MALHHMLRAAAGASAPSDPNFKNVSLLLQGNGTNGAQNNTFLDSSTNNFTITRNGNTTQGTFSPYGNLWSNYFDGSGDYLTTPNNAAFDLGTSDATIETWFMVTGNAALDNDGLRPAVLLSTYTSSLSNAYAFSVVGSSTITGTGLEFARWSSGVKSGVTYTGTISQNVWHHVAVVRSGSNLTLYYDGVSVATNNSFSGNINAGGQSLNIARLGLLGYIYDFNGYISNTRIVKGTALYTSNFTPSTTPLTAVSGTSLLTCQSNRFKDNSSNNFTLTVNGNTSVQRFSPFNPTAAYSASTIGGSGYFDGTGDELNVGSNTAFAFGTGAYTVEFFVYLNAAISSSHQPSFVFNDATGGWGIYNSTSYLEIANRGVGTVLGSSVSLLPNLWNHVVAVRSGTGTNQTSIFVNGVRVGNGTDSGNWTVTGPLKIGGLSLTNLYVNGYMSNIRIVKGTAVYDPTQSTITVPTAPLTAITNTSLLCNFTNAGIPDAAMMNDLETVGNAQVSTSVKKYGTGSLAFDGSGDYLMSPANGAFGLTGDFTIECWYYLNVVNNFNMILGSVGSSPSDYLAIRASVIEMAINGANYPVWSATSTTNTWYHLAIVRQNGVIKAYRNGSALTLTGGTSTDSTVFLPINQGIYVGRYGYTADWFFNGYIDDIRITKGYARYTANFTPPTAALPTY